MLDDVNVDTFAGRVGELFHVSLGDAEAIAVELREVTAVGRPYREGGRAPFSLVFVGPGEPVLPQQIYALDHDALGRLDIFLVPIAQDESGTSYEATFA